MFIPDSRVVKKSEVSFFKIKFLDYNWNYHTIVGILMNSSMNPFSFKIFGTCWQISQILDLDIELEKKS